jgi:hypothetical protein
MNDTSRLDNIRRAELARANLARDLAGVVRTGESLVKRGQTLLRRAVPLVIALAVVGFSIAAALRRRGPRRCVQRPRSLSSELARRAASSAVAVLASRLARRLPLPAPGETSGRPRLFGADLDPMLPERRAREGSRPGARA